MSSDLADEDMFRCRRCNTSFVVMCTAGKNPDPVPRFCPFCGQKDIIADELISEMYAVPEPPKN